MILFPFSLFSGSGNIIATGGTIVDNGGYRYHTFTSSGTFDVTYVPAAATIDYLLVAGGGASTGFTGAGGGGVVIKTAQAVSVQAYTVTIGAGGVVSGTPALTDGGNTTFNSDVALGGGGAGRNGGSGGGAADPDPVGVGQQPGSASGGYGNDGATDGVDGGGGGGAGGAASGSSGGIGISGSPLSASTFAAGGGGENGGTGAGGANTGNGGSRTGGSDSAGGSGITVIRYAYTA